MVVSRKIALGKQGLEVSELGYGCMGLTTAYGSKLTRDEVVTMLKVVYENGVSFWDTANLYVFPDFWRVLSLRSPIVCQEELIAHAIKEIGRENLVVATKTGIEIAVFPKLKFVANGNPDFVRKQCEASLSRLGVDCLDLFYLHRIDQNIPIEVTMATMRDLVNEGKVKYVGLSECSAKTLRRAHRVHPITCVQIEYSLWSRDVEDELIPTCAELGVGVVAYSPLGRGFFSDEVTKDFKYKAGDFRAGQPRTSGKNLERNYEALERVQQIAKEKGCTTAQLALAWVKHKAPLLNGAGVVAIPGTTKEKNLLSNVDAVDIALSESEMAALEAAVPKEHVAGDRYNPDVDTFAGDNNKELPPGEAEKYYR
eukprot:Plantae.Rhodophyta-Purpureofilum_apyrenoidigerum.ctg14940.p1 GENE.Plantae.Rhodophyta-Purpureofilum_apyrenoidigerum.ctg14940~~Plantae.Rhodophyta-Purpureofilum_apyrenoidigerum.ctg14940.p1  ORF type:complete len:394 (+),score=93.90 Plantae.Rhodophyta-Purpureofilum_apyrenoidigerum.ctg14940:81-1184(+)